MHSRTIKFDDLDGNPVEEEFWFHLSKGELVELNLGVKGGSLEALIKEIVADEDGEKIIANFKKIIRMSVGRRDPNNRRFIKNEDLTENFMQSDAYSELFLLLVQDAKAAAEFIALTVPANLSDKIPVAGENNTAPVQPEVVAETLPVKQVRTALGIPTEPADIDLSNMSREELQEAFTKMRQEQLRNPQ